MSSIPFDLKQIQAFVLDVDGVISSTTSPLDALGNPMRTANIKDGYAMQLAIQKGYLIAIISGGDSPAMRQRLERLGVQHIYMKVKDKGAQILELSRCSGIPLSTMVYIGDDMPDLAPMQQVALPCAPADAVAEVKQVARYVSLAKGGEGVVRDVIEQTLKAVGAWE